MGFISVSLLALKCWLWLAEISDDSTAIIYMMIFFTLNCGRVTVIGHISGAMTSIVNSVKSLMCSCNPEITICTAAIAHERPVEL